MKDYKKFLVWQKAHQLTLEIYRVTKNFPKSEQFNLISQINRASLSIPTNIAEGCGRESQKELIRFLYISSGSAHEMEYFLLVSKDLGFIEKDLYNKLNSEVNEIKKMLASLIRKIAETVNR
ncbi:four helix bundle protein [Flavobacterium coralii]|uniref:four helix bundle protein n=1 Tax=Flavobacterium coralii TaxID=2838017 RepID=UPI000C59F746|nr:four helix bundle protein [Flavobacterium sp.]|tara:strand:- start:64468 stop:64833 length:366 start_codon:yes stop_codon:yes gene_type:complete